MRITAEDRKRRQDAHDERIKDREARKRRWRLTRFHAIFWHRCDVCGADVVGERMWWCRREVKRRDYHEDDIGMIYPYEIVGLKRTYRCTECRPMPRVP